MADHFYSVVPGDQAVGDVTVGTSTSSEAVELRVTDGTAGVVGEKVKLLELIDLIRNKIAVSDAPA